MSLRRRHLRRIQESVVCTFKSQCPLKSEIGYFCTHVHNFINLLAICRSRMSNKRNQYSSKRGYKKRHNSHSCRDIFSSIWSSDNGYVNLFFFVSPGSEDGLWYAIFFIILVISVIYYVTSMKQLRDAGQWCWKMAINILTIRTLLLWKLNFPTLNIVSDIIILL